MSDEKRLEEIREWLQDGLKFTGLDLGKLAGTAYERPAFLLGLLDAARAELQAERAETDRLRALAAKLECVRAETIEQCAKVAEEYDGQSGAWVAEQIRALGDK
jgi:hypothetical protein